MSDKSKAPLLIGLVVVGVALAFAYPRVKWFQYEMKVRDAFRDGAVVGRFPSAEAIIAAGPKFVGMAQADGFEGAQASSQLEARKVQMGQVWWFYRVSITAGSHTFTHERRVESEFSQEMLDQLAEAGVVLKGL